MSKNSYVVLGDDGLKRIVDEDELVGYGPRPLMAAKKNVLSYSAKVAPSGGSGSLVSSEDNVSANLQAGMAVFASQAQQMANQGQLSQQGLQLILTQIAWVDQLLTARAAYKQEHPGS